MAMFKSLSVCVKSVQVAVWLHVEIVCVFNWIKNNAYHGGSHQSCFFCCEITHLLCGLLSVLFRCEKMLRE